MAPRVRVVLLALAAALTACGGSDDPPAPLSVGSQPLAGRIGGRAWTFLHGKTDAYLSGTQPDFFGMLFADGAGGCGAFSSSDRVLLDVPKIAGDYPFSTTRNGTFVVGSSTNLVATRGRIIVEQVTAESVTARVHMVFDASNEIDGEFVASVCP